MFQLPACPCWLIILLEAPGCRSQQGELGKWPFCLPWEAWESSSLGNLPPLALLQSERTGTEHSSWNKGVFCITLIWGQVGHTPQVELFPSFGGSALSLNWRSSHHTAGFWQVALFTTVIATTGGSCAPSPLRLFCAHPCPFLFSAQLTSQLWFYQPLLNGSWTSDTGT